MDYFKKSLALHKKKKGKLEIKSKVALENKNDLSIAYTPGVAEPCRKIFKNPSDVYQYTIKGNSVAVVTNGTAVLGLGNIGPEAALPVMEGKCLLFKKFANIDAYPICLDTQNNQEFIKAVKMIAPGFGGINLEDIKAPDCFEIEERLKKELDIPVFHDDQHGTAIVVLAALINALKVVGKKLEDIRVAMVGAGAANIAVAKLIILAGVKAANIVMCDTKGILHQKRSDILEKEKWEICRITNSQGKKGGIREAMEAVDVVIALSIPNPDTIKREWISRMNKDPIIFACANPVPEILPDEAKKGGARIVATGGAQFPNQVNNSLCFPGMFRGVLDVQAKAITDEMCMEAAKEIARYAQERGINEEYIVPTMEEWKIYPRQAAAVGVKAIEQGVARLKLTREELYQKALSTIKKVREETQALLDAHP